MKKKKSQIYIIKGLGSIRGLFGLRVPENLKFLILFGFRSHNNKGKTYTQTLVCMFTVAIETPTNKAKFQNFQHLSAVFEASN